MTKREAFEIGYQQLAVDYNASPEDFIRSGITFTTPAQNPGRRAYSSKMPFFELVTVGHSAVIMADESLRPELDRWVKGVEHPHWLLELPRLLHLSEILAPYGYKLTQTHHGYLPASDFTMPKAPADINLRWLEQKDIAGLYPNTNWPNALQDAENPARPDILALAAVDNDTTIGIAGASMDAPEMWQIGIDVLPEYRGRGLGRLLVQGLAAEVERREAMPFYYSSLSNIHSQNIAIGCGFRPAWVDISAEEKES